MLLFRGSNDRITLYDVNEDTFTDSVANGKFKSGCVFKHNCNNSTKYISFNYQQTVLYNH